MREHLTSITDNEYVDLLAENSSFRWFLTGDLVTNVGNSLYTIAAMWLVYELSGSTFYTGLAVFVTRIPQLFRFLTGPIVDEYAPRRILVSSQLLQMSFVAVVPLAFYLGDLDVTVVLGVMAVVGVVTQFVSPTQSATLPRLVENEHLSHANAMFTFTSRSTDMLFNALAGLLISAIGAVALFVVDALTFTVAALCYAAVHVAADEDDRSEDSSSYLEDVREGMAYLSGSVLLLVVVSSMVLNTAFGAILAVLPKFADLQGGSVMFGVLMAGIGAGTILGSFFASRIRDRSFGAVSIVGFVLSGGLVAAGTVVPGRVPVVAAFSLAMIPVGVFNVFVMTTTQTIVPDDLLGRVTATLGSTTGIATPVGSLLGGYLGGIVGTPTVIAVAGGGLMCSGVYWLVVPRLRTFPSLTELERDARPDGA